MWGVFYWIFEQGWVGFKEQVVSFDWGGGGQESLQEVSWSRVLRRYVDVYWSSGEGGIQRGS